MNSSARLLVSFCNFWNWNFCKNLLCHFCNNFWEPFLVGGLSHMKKIKILIAKYIQWTSCRDSLRMSKIRQTITWELITLCVCVGGWVGVSIVHSYTHVCNFLIDLRIVYKPKSRCSKRRCKLTTKVIGVG